MNLSYGQFLNIAPLMTVCYFTQKSTFFVSEVPVILLVDVYVFVCVWGCGGRYFFIVLIL